jgi:hypothetical protein
MGVVGRNPVWGTGLGQTTIRIVENVSSWSVPENLSSDIDEMEVAEQGGRGVWSFLATIVALRTGENGNILGMVFVSKVVECDVVDHKTVSLGGHNSVTVSVHTVISRVSVGPADNHGSINFCHRS